MVNRALDDTRIGGVEARPGDTEAFTSYILPTFEDYSCMCEGELGEQMWRAQVEKDRKERKTREDFEVRMAFGLCSTTLTRGDTFLGSLARTRQSG